MYLSYDIKGIQQFIFNIPRLRYMIGGSGQISQFDEHWENVANLPAGSECIFAGGGRGIVSCPSDQVAELKIEFIRRAHLNGFDIRLGSAENFDDALENGDELYPFVLSPDKLKGRPCSESGLYPVAGSVQTSSTQRKYKPHELIRRRGVIAKQDPLGGAIIKRIKKLASHQMLLDRAGACSVEFIRNVKPELQAGDDEDAVSHDEIKADVDSARAGQASLGNRNRWAVIVMDGNAIGKRFREIAEKASNPSKALSETSQALKGITQTACDNAVVQVITQWSSQLDEHSLKQCCYKNASSGNAHLVVPLRPILVGGDDLIVLCHPSHAMTFVETMARRFEEESENVGKVGEQLAGTVGFNPWRGNGGKLAISAGVLFAKTSLPLHVAIPYAEALLANAKQAFRSSEASDEPVPSSVDWEVVTDTMLEHPSTRRKRTLQLLDDDLGLHLLLTRRPYRLDETSGPQAPSFPRLRKQVMELVSDLPNSIRHELADSLRMPWANRTQFLCALAKDKKYRKLIEGLQIDPDSPETHLAHWTDVSERNDDGNLIGKLTLATDVIDAITLIDEGQRQDIPTARQA